MSAKLDVEGYGAEIHTARRVWRCSGRLSRDCTSTIQPGDRYVRHVASPRAEYCDCGRWHSMAECGPCYVDRKRGGQAIRERHLMSVAA